MGSIEECRENERLRELLIQNCNTRNTLTCKGLPPLSCKAFGKTFQPRANDETKCLRCEGTAGAIAGLSVLATLFVLGLVAYIRLIQKYPAAIKRWIATAAIMVNHVQTVSILGNLRLEFPPAVEVITSGAGLDILEMIGSVRPECLLVDTGISAFILAILVVWCGAVAVLVGFLTVQFFVGLRCWDRLFCAGRPEDEQAAARAARVDNVEFATTILYSAQVR